MLDNEVESDRKSVVGEPRRRRLEVGIGIVMNAKEAIGHG